MVNRTASVDISAGSGGFTFRDSPEEAIIPALGRDGTFRELIQVDHTGNVSSVFGADQRASLESIQGTNDWRLLHFHTDSNQGGTYEVVLGEFNLETPSAGLVTADATMAAASSAHLINVTPFEYETGDSAAQLTPTGSYDIAFVHIADQMGTPSWSFAGTNTPVAHEGITDIVASGATFRFTSATGAGERLVGQLIWGVLR